MSRKMKIFQGLCLAIILGSGLWMWREYSVAEEFYSDLRKARVEAKDQEKTANADFLRREDRCERIHKKWTEEALKDMKSNKSKQLNNEYLHCLGTLDDSTVMLTCNDKQECTLDYAATGKCAHINKDNGVPCGSGKSGICQSGRCTTK